MGHKTKALRGFCRAAVIAVMLGVSAAHGQLPGTADYRTSFPTVSSRQNLPVVGGHAGPTQSYSQTSFEQLFAPEQPGFAAQLNSGLPPGDHVLPDGLLYRSYIAAPHEPRFATVALYDYGAKSWRWDATIGGRVGLFRRDQPEFLNLDAWQIDLEGAALPRLDPQKSMDVESIDYRFGLLWTGKQDNLAFKFGYFHVSSHVGDEYQLKNPTFERINYVRESLILGTSYYPTADWRLYGEAAFAVEYGGGAKPWQFQGGAEYTPQASDPKAGAPFIAVNAHSLESTTRSDKDFVTQERQMKHVPGLPAKFTAQVPPRLSQYVSTTSLPASWSSLARAMAIRMCLRHSG
ncbi:MAG: DUF1207 domain-containing protein [Planctomycetaceae bacterium]